MHAGLRFDCSPWLQRFLGRYDRPGGLARLDKIADPVQGPTDMLRLRKKGEKGKTGCPKLWFSSLSRL
jgi:hypothetical protein